MLLNLILSLLVGLIAGWLAGKFVHGRGYGLVGDTIIGLVGGLIGTLIFWVFGLGSENLIGSIFVSFIGAAILLSVTKMLKNDAARIS